MKSSPQQKSGPDVPPPTVADEARALFERSGLVFPEIPPDLAVHLVEARAWGYTTRADELAPYAFEKYVRELDDPALPDYVILAYDGHGVNSHMMHYYLVKGPLRLLLQIPYGGVYGPEPQTTDFLNDCLQLAGEITRAAESARLSAPEDRFTILCSTKHGWCWSAMRAGKGYGSEGAKRPKECLEEAWSVLNEWGTDRRPSDRERAMLDQLLEDSRLFTSSKAFMELLKFVLRVPHLAPFNAMLLEIQKPGISYAATAGQWLTQFGRTPVEGARPLVILWPFGPVGFVYDVMDTVGPPLPDAVEAFFARGPITAETMTAFEKRLDRKRIRFVWIDAGDYSAGAIRREQYLADGEVAIRYHIRINRNHPPPTQFATLTHELGHLFLGHLGDDDALKIAGNRDRPGDLREIEAEVVSYLVCNRNGVRTRSEQYIADYMNANVTIGHLDVYQVMKAAGQVERLLGLGWPDEGKGRRSDTPTAQE